MFNWLMKMFGFLKRKSAKDYKETINLYEAEEWILNTTRKEMKHLIDDLDDEFDKILSEVKGLKKRASLMEEESENLKNLPDTSEEESADAKKTIQAFAKKLADLTIKLSFAEDITFTTAQEYLDKNKNTVKNFLKETEEAKKKAREYFSADMDKIDEHLSKITESIDSIRDISSNKIASNIEKIKKELEKMGELVNKKNDYSEMISENESRFDKFKMEKDACEDKVAELVKSKEYVEFDRMRLEIEAIDKKIKDNKKALKSDFIGIDLALKKFNEIEKEHETIIEKYRHDAEEAILADVELKIITALRSLAARIDDVEPDAKKKDKLLAKINAIDEIYFQKFVNEKENLEFDKNGLKRRINLVTVKKEIDDLEYKAKHLDDKMKTLTKDITKLNHALDKTDVEDMKKKIENDIKELTGQKVEIEIKLADEESEEKEDEKADKDK